jgi:hypothetical protein
MITTCDGIAFRKPALEHNTDTLPMRITTVHSYLSTCFLLTVSLKMLSVAEVYNVEWYG